MSFISYAQNYEDVMLWRALKHVEKGFYIDVGAAWPETDSVTKAFYDYGWSGINIEPNEALFQRLSLERGRDINIQVAISDRDGKATINLISDTGLSTVSEDIANKHSQQGWTVHQATVSTTTLENIWSVYVPKGQDVHFLKVDVEGLEEDVLRSNNWSFFRPWIVVVEATFPLSPTERYSGWEPILLVENYTFAYADGLNRFYVAQEHIDLLAAFKYPPNIFDNFINHNQSQAQEELQVMRQKLKRERDTARYWWETACTLNQEIEEMTNNLSWSITRLLRSSRLIKPLKPFLKKLLLLVKELKIFLVHLSQSASFRIMGFGKAILAKVAKSLEKKPYLKGKILQQIRRRPGIKAKLKGVIESSVVSKKQPIMQAYRDETVSDIFANSKGVSVLSSKIDVEEAPVHKVLEHLSFKLMLSQETQILSLNKKSEGDKW
jgi:FkbM family methyltransferase